MNKGFDLLVAAVQEDLSSKCNDLFTNAIVPKLAEFVSTSKSAETLLEETDLLKVFEEMNAKS